MSKVADVFTNFLDHGGKDLGYDFGCCPEIKDFSVVLNKRVPVWQYYGFNSEEEYYDSKGHNEPVEW